MLVSLKSGDLSTIIIALRAFHTRLSGCFSGDQMPSYVCSELEDISCIVEYLEFKRNPFKDSDNG